MKTPADIVVEKALKLLKKKGLCRGAEARTKTGFVTSPLKRTAVTFSITGALYREASRYNDWVRIYMDAYLRFDDQSRGKHGVGLIEYNDSVAECAEDFEKLLELKK